MTNNIIFSIGPCFGKTKTNTIKQYSIYITEENIDGDYIYAIHQVHGLELGKKQESLFYISQGKNIGRSSETTPKEQAILEAKAKYQKKLNERYTEDKTSLLNSPVTLRPMLAKNHRDNGDKIVYPCLAQAKLNGVRCLAHLDENGNVVYESRNGKIYTTLKHLDKEVKELLKITQQECLDGEIYVKGMSFQEIVRRVKKYRSGKTEELKYTIYDLANPILTNKERWNLLISSLNNWNFTNLLLVESRELKSEEEMFGYLAELEKLGYEGIILRNYKGMYLYGYRSEDLQKRKNFIDEEFEIVDIVESFKTKVNGNGVKTEIRYATFVCKLLTSDKIFNCNPDGELEGRSEYFDHKEKYIGQMLTVKFQEKSEDGTPIFPIAIIERDYE